MSATTMELQQIMQTLDGLQKRVAEIAEAEETRAVESAPEAPPVDEVRESGKSTTPDEKAAAFRLMNDGLRGLDRCTSVKAVPKFFVRIAEQVGLRLMLLKRWRSGLQVFQTEGIELPDAAYEKSADGRAPIPLPDGDVFSAVCDDRSAYCGPVPIKSFPLDLTLMLGQGSADRYIVLIPLPSRDRWSTVLYLDADEASGASIEALEVLARFAVARLRLLALGDNSGNRLVRAIYDEELGRRRKRGHGRKAPTAGAEPAEPVRPRMQASPPRPASGAPKAAGTGAITGRIPIDEAVEQVEQADASSTSLASRLDERQRADMDAAGMAIEDLYLSAVAPSRPEAEAAREDHDDEDEVLDPSLTPEALLRHSGELPALPRAACHIMAVIDDPRTTAPKLEKAIALDQALTAKVLRIANSPFYGAVRDIKTVSEAIVRLGFVAIRNWTLVTATKSVFLTPGSGLLFQKIWKQSVMTAMASQLVAQVVRYQDPESVFIGGLMQNIGQLVLAKAEPELFHQIVGESANRGRPYHEIERRLLGFDHGELGALLIGEWNLSSELEDAVRYHHRLDHLPERNVVAAMIALGEELAAVSGSAIDDDDSFYELSHAASYLDVSAEQYQELKGKAHQLNIDPKFFS